MPTPPRDEKGRFVARPKTEPPQPAEGWYDRGGVVPPAKGSRPVPYELVTSSASRPRPRASIVHDVVPEPRRRVWPRLVVVVCVAMAAVVAAIVWAVTHR